MIQQVNLYKDILRQEQHKSSINLYWLGLAAAILVFAGLSLYLLWSVKNTEAQVQQLRQQLQAEQAKIQNLSAKIPKQDINPQLAAEVMLWQSMLDELTQTYQLLSGKNTELSPGFSNYFQALANQSIPDVWLSALYFDSQQQIINIEGSTFNPGQIPYFLQQLQKEPIFSGHNFAQLVMQKAKEIPDQIDFKLSTKMEVPDKKGHAQ